MYKATCIILDNRDSVTETSVTKTGDTSSEARWAAYRAAERICVAKNEYEGMMRFVPLSPAHSERFSR